MRATWAGPSSAGWCATRVSSACRWCSRRRRASRAGSARSRCCGAGRAGRDRRGPLRPGPQPGARAGLRPRGRGLGRAAPRAGRLRALGGGRVRGRDGLPERPGRQALRRPRGLPLGQVAGLRGPAVRHARPLLDRGTPGPRLDLALRLGRRLPRRAEGPARAAGRPAGRARGPVPRARLRRHRPDRGTGLRRRGRAGRLGQEHLPAAPRARLVVLPGRARDRPRPGARRAAARPVRLVHGLPRGLSHGRAAGSLPARRHALHQLPDHRAARAPFPRSCALRWAGTPSAATSARTSAPGTAGAGSAAVRPSRPGPDWPRPSSPSWPRSTRPPSPRASARARSSAPSGAACCATWRWRWATWAGPRPGRCWSGWRPTTTRLVQEHARWALRRLDEREA